MDKEYNKSRYDRKNAYKKKALRRNKEYQREYDKGFGGNV